MRLIDADALIEAYLGHCRTEFEIKNCCMADENVIAIIQNTPTFEDRDLYNMGYFDGKKNALNSLYGLRAAKLNEDRPECNWIPVSERLPERYKEVIVTDMETIDTYVSRYIGNGYWECDDGTFKNRIIAWMALPEPYKEADNET